MIYQIFYNQYTKSKISNDNPAITPFGVNNADGSNKLNGAIYDHELKPNLSDHNTLCEWRVLYYVWKHYKSDWIGFTSWRHDAKKFYPQIDNIDGSWLKDILTKNKIYGFIVRSLEEVTLEGLKYEDDMTLKTQFLQWSIIEKILNKSVNDIRKKPMGRFHTLPYWQFVINEYKRIHGINLEKDLNWIALGKVTSLYTWCNAFVARWDYFNDYMRMFSPIVLSLLSYFGSHPTELELSYICERLIIIYNYIKYSENETL